MPFFFLNNLNRRFSHETLSNNSLERKSRDLGNDIDDPVISHLNWIILFFCHDNALRPTQTVFLFIILWFAMMSFFQDERSLKQLSNATQDRRWKASKKLSHIWKWLEHLELYIGGNFFYQKKLFTIFSIIVNSFCAVLATRALFRVLKQRNNIFEFKAYW